MILIDKNYKDDVLKALELSATEPVLLLIDKATDWTSFDVVAKLRGMLRTRKIGHAGTLDPLATGLLMLGIGKGTKKLTDLTGLGKTYTGKIKFGASTKTDDAEGEEENITDISDLTIEKIEDTKLKFLGEIDQLPPRFSAKKINGKKMYQMARKGEEFLRTPVKVTINDFTINNFKSPYCEFELSCSKGTYIRAIARDMGEELGCGGYLAGLRRTKIDIYDVSNAYTLDELDQVLKLARAEQENAEIKDTNSDSNYDLNSKNPK